MKHVELMSELMVSINQGDVVNRKAALDKVMATGDFTQAQTRKASKKTQAALRKLRKIFPSLHSTRFRQLTDFYSLLVLVAKFIDEGLILDDRRRNRLAQDLLIAFGTNVDQVRENQRRAIGIKPHQEVYRDYLLTVSQMSDDVNQRRKRESILRNILESLFARKDAQRGFTSEQRRIMWNTATNRRCPGSKCGGKLLSWNDFTLDHIDPHSKGGRSRLRNAALMCRSCNSAKGNRRRR
jgi:predicted MPP superfamily phosphohydrolase